MVPAHHNKRKHQPPGRGGDSELAREFQAAFQMYQGGKLAEAERLFLKLRRLVPSNGDVLHLLGLIAYQTGRHDEALSYLRDGALLMDQSPHIMNSLGVVLLEMGRNEEAIEVLQRATALQADFSEAHNNLGNALRKSGTRTRQSKPTTGRSR